VHTSFILSLNYSPFLASITVIEQLGFEIGDELTSLTAAQWEAAGVGALAQKCVIKAYRQYKKDLVDGNI
jgi:hypothetical protein